ncbi:MAG: hypothetical protein ACYC6M_14435 [Terriglobales bacterium]
MRRNGEAARTERMERILTALRMGVSRKDAFTSAGISGDCFYTWLKRPGTRSFRTAEGQPPAVITFADAVEKAEADFVISMVGVVRKAAAGAKDAPGSWQAAAWLLERRRPGDFKQASVVEHTGAGGGPVQFVVEAPVQAPSIDAWARVVNETAEPLRLVDASRPGETASEKKTA